MCTTVGDLDLHMTHELFHLLRLRGVESMGVANGHVVSRRWVWLVGGIYGCG